MTTEQLELFEFECPFCNNEKYEWIAYEPSTGVYMNRDSILDLGSRGKYWDGSPYMDCCIELYNTMAQVQETCTSLENCQRTRGW